ncbi:MAG TPA: HEPN domain-containing protein [Sedimentisphaerales bacterium]|jgi:HEPN domain-containing protein|nr:HEPN domain-containing protein [Sedimentisphaerales bacterium]HNU29091.1 HEPN domain-containing protein [Sedimentisphaerales bacterium]
MADRSGDWFAQARRDLDHAADASEHGHFEWACFSSQQGAEKAVKAVYLRLHGESWGHSVLKLLQGLADKVSISESLLDAARALDRHYIPTRYPNGFDQGSPGDYYTRKEAEEAIAYAGQIVGFCESLLCG